jgi:hypothetical protein
MVVHREGRRGYVRTDPDPKHPTESRCRTIPATALGGQVSLPEPCPAPDTTCLVR